jgi:hypothetical protein
MFLHAMDNLDCNSIQFFEPSANCSAHARHIKISGSHVCTSRANLITTLTTSTSRWHSFSPFAKTYVNAVRSMPKCLVLYSSTRSECASQYPRATIYFAWDSTYPRSGPVITQNASLSHPRGLRRLPCRGSFNQN